jgi:hypothetical protein
MAVGHVKYSALIQPNQGAQPWEEFILASVQHKPHYNGKHRCYPGLIVELLNPHGVEFTGPLSCLRSSSLHLHDGPASAAQRVWFQGHSLNCLKLLLGCMDVIMHEVPRPMRDG